MNGFLPVNKPAGMTSAAVVARIKRLLPKGTKVGHTGTLDPDASGVLPIAIGKATRLFDYMADKEKSYECTLVPGILTDTLDMSGQVLQREEVSLTGAEVEAVLPQLVGDIQQVPPLVSALKKDGKRLYQYARNGETVEIPAREVHVEQLRLLETLPEGRFRLRIVCGRGTYIRSLCRDIGQALGTVAVMDQLVRTSTGPFTLENAVPVDAIEGISWMEEHLVPMDFPLNHLPHIAVKPAARRFVMNGVPLEPREVVSFPEQEGPLCLYIQDEFCGIGHAEKQQIIIDAMLLER